MARTAVPYSTLVPNGELADPAGTAVTSGAGNGGQIPDVSPNRRQSHPELILLRIANASGSTGTATVKAGANPPALAGGQGDLTSTNILTATSRFMGPFESGRFLQTDGSLIVETTQNMTITAFRFPRNT
jgi:hypothetical protein